MKRANDPDLMTSHDVAQLLGICEKKVREGAARGEIPSRRVGRFFFFSRACLAAWLHSAPTVPITRRR